MQGHEPSHDDPSEVVIRGWIDAASWLSGDTLIALGWFHMRADSIDVAMHVGDETIPVRTRCMSYPRPDIPGSDRCAGKILLFAFDSPPRTGELLGDLVVRAGDVTFAVGPSDLTRAVVELPHLIHRNCLAPDDAMRRELLELLGSILTERSAQTIDVALNESIFAIREAVRTPLPRCVIAPDRPLALQIDTLVGIDDHLFYIKGWMRDAEAGITALTVVSPEGDRAELEDLFRFRRPDVEQFYGASVGDQQTAKPGFVGSFRIGTPSHLATGWIVEMRNARGDAIETSTPAVARDAHAVRDTILGDLALLGEQKDDDLLLGHLFAAVGRLQERLRHHDAVKYIVQYGEPVRSPEVSIIVPLYQRIDFLEHQLAQFVHDPGIRRVDLIYVLDSPELADALTTLAGQLFQLYQLPFRTVILERNAGFSDANNAGAALANGRLLLLLNSDVLPEKPGWLERMVSFYDATPKIGALGPKLLYEDGSLQHAGMYFSRATGSRVWGNQHYFKGLHRAFPAANIARSVPAVTGACLLIARDLFHGMGGLQGAYVQGDYEDSDLCLRLFRAGYDSWYVPDAELYHLEGQSYGFALRRLVSKYNTYLHSHLWNDTIEEVMARYGSTFPLADAPAVASPGRTTLDPVTGSERGRDTVESWDNPGLPNHRKEHASIPIDSAHGRPTNGGGPAGRPDRTVPKKRRRMASISGAAIIGNEDE